MNFPVVSPEQKTVLDRLNQVRTIRYNDQNMAMETILLAVVNLISKGEKCILISSNEAILKKMYTLFSACGLQHYSLTISPKQQVTNNDIRYITHCINEQVQNYHNNSSTAYDGMLSSLNRITNQCISQIYHSDEAYDFKDILNKLIHIPENIESNLLQVHLSDGLINLDESEFETHLMMVKKAEEMYHLSYDNELYVTLAQKLQSNWYQDEDRKDAMLIKLKDYISELNIIRNHYYTALSAEYQDELSNHEEKYTDLFSAIENLKWMCYQYQVQLETDKLNQGVFNLFFKEDKSLQKYRQEILKNFKLLHAKLEKESIKVNSDFILSELDKQLNKLNTYFEHAELSLENWFHTEKQKIKNQHKYFNKFNFTKNQSIVNLEKELIYVLDRLNSECFFVDDKEINTISIFKQVESIDNLILELGNICDLLENKRDFFEWQCFLNNQNEHGKRIIEIMKHLPIASWSKTFEKWYYENWLKKNRNPFNSKLDTMIRQIFELETEHISLASDSICRNQYLQANVFNQKLKTSYQELYKVLYKNKPPDELNWRYFFEKHALPFSWYFNLIISSDDSFSDIPDKTFEHIFYIDYDDINPDVLGTAKTVHTYLPIGKRKLEKDELTLKMSAQDMNVLNHDITPTLQLEKAKFLTSLLTSCDPVVSIFQLKNANIISCLNNEHHKNILSYTQSKGIKEIIRPNAWEDLILESCLEKDRKSFLLCENLLLQPTQINNIAWQYFVISNFAKAGFTVLSLSTSDIMENYHEAIQKICRQFS